MTLEESLRYMENVRKRLEIANGEHIRRTFTMPDLSKGLLDSVRYFSDVLADVTRLEHPAVFAQYEVDTLRNISSIMSNFYEILNSNSLDGISSVFDDFQEILVNYNENQIACNDSEDVAASIMSNFYEILNSNSLDGISSVFDDFQEILVNYNENQIACNDSEDVAASEELTNLCNKFIDTRTIGIDDSVKPLFPKLEANPTLISIILFIAAYFISNPSLDSRIDININININPENVTNETDNINEELNTENQEEFQKRLQAQLQEIIKRTKSEFLSHE